MNHWSSTPSRRFSGPPSGWRMLSSALLMGLAGAASAAVTLNEVDSATLQYTPNTEGFQFVELKGTPGESLNGHTVVFYNGANDAVYRVVALDGYAIGASGFFVLGNAGVPNVDLVLPAVTTVGASNNPPVDDTIQPGPDAVALYRNTGAAYDPSSFVTRGVPPVGRAATAVNGEADEVRLDALLYTSFNASIDVDLSTALVQPAQYDENANGLRLTQSLQKNGAVWEAHEPSPGADNFPAFPADGKLFVQVDDPDLTVTEGDSSMAARVLLQNADGSPRVAPAGGLTVTVKTTDFSEAALDTSPPSALQSTLAITIPAGASSSADFIVTPMDDAHPDGSGAAFFTATATGAVASHTCWLLVNDGAGETAPALTINEINGRVPSGVDAQPGVDANGDAMITDADQFVEIINTSGAAVDLSGQVLANNAAALITLPPCTVLQPGQSLLVFGSGAAVTPGVTAEFGSALVQKTAAPLGLGTHSAVRLLNGSTEIAGAVFAPLEGGSSGASDSRYGSLWTEVASDGGTAYDAPFFTPSAPAGQTGFVFNGGGRWSTPGLDASGAPLFAIAAGQVLTLTYSDTLTSTANALCVPELWGQNAATLTISRPAGGPNTTVAPVCLTRTNSNGAALAPFLNTTPGTAAADGSNVYTIPAGVDSITLTLHTRDSVAGNGDNTHGVTAFSPVYRNIPEKSIIVRDSAALLSLKCSSIVESAGAGANVLNVAGGVGSSPFIVRSEPSTGALAAEVTGSAGGVFAGSLTAGGTVALPVNSLNDLPVLNRKARFTFLSGPASDCRNASIELDVVDDGGVIELGPFINEADTVQPGADDDFVELTAPAAGGKSLSGFVVVVYRPDGTVLATADLSGRSFPGGSDFFLLTASLPASATLLNTAPIGGLNWLPSEGAVAIYRGAPADYLPGSVVTCRNLVDALVFNAANPLLQDTLTPGQAFKSESGCIIARNPNASLASHLRNTTTYDGTIQHRTPGFSNTGALSGYNAYAARFPALAGALPDADTDGDGIKNLLEYFMGTNPTAFTPPIPPVISAGHLTLTVDRGFDSACDTHLNLIGESSTDLVSWTPMSASGTDPVIFSTPVAGPVLFGRLKITVVP